MRPNPETPSSVENSRQSVSHPPGAFDQIRVNSTSFLTSPQRNGYERLISVINALFFKSPMISPFQTAAPRLTKMSPQTRKQGVFRLTLSRNPGVFPPNHGCQKD